MPMADELAVYLARDKYHPRSSAHSDFQSYVIIRDLISNCPLIAARAKKGEIVAKLRHHQQVGHADWVIDIAIGTCAGPPKPPASEGKLGLMPITIADPVLIQIAIELKGVMTEHKKQRLNRLRDFGAFHGHGHEYDPRTVVATFLVVNSAEYFYSPLNFGKTNRPEINTHMRPRRSARQLAKECIDDFRSVHLRHAPNDQPGVEAIGAVVIEHDNLDLYPEPAKYASLHKPTTVAPTPPNLPSGDPMSYESMIQRICAHYTERFSNRAG